MKCKECGKDITGDEYRKVADWPFCLECFGKLMDKSGKESEAESTPQFESDDVDTISIDEKRPVCQICNRELENGEVKKVGIWNFCTKCHSELVFRSPEPGISKEIPGEDMDDPQKEKPETDTQPLGRVRVSMSKSVNCHACGRQILAVASREVDGNPFCPDCFYALPEQVDVDRKADIKPAQKSVPATTDSKPVTECESCGKQIMQGDFDTVEGFVICRACLTTNQELAVQVAKKRHQQYLQKIENEFGK
jgi:ribosomal protein L37AE/L43A